MESPLAVSSIDDWKEVIPSRPDVLLAGMEVFRDYLVLSERTKASTQIRIIGQLEKSDTYIPFSETAYVADVAYNPEFNTGKLRFSYAQYENAAFHLRV